MWDCASVSFRSFRRRTPAPRTRAVEDQLVLGVEIRTPAILVLGQPDLATLGALRDDRDLLGAHDGSAVPTPSIGFGPAGTSSTADPFFLAFFAATATTTTPTPASAQPVRLTASSPPEIVEAPRPSRRHGSRQVATGSRRLVTVEDLVFRVLRKEYRSFTHPPSAMLAFAGTRTLTVPSPGHATGRRGAARAAPLATQAYVNSACLSFR